MGKVFLVGWGFEDYGEVGKHARSAVGMAVLPLNASVEIELSVEI